MAVAFSSPANAQSIEQDCTCRPGWQLIAAFVLGAFVVAVAGLLATRWRPLFHRNHE
jgi:hypothetical protein